MGETRLAREQGDQTEQKDLKGDLCSAAEGDPLALYRFSRELEQSVGLSGISDRTTRDLQAGDMKVESKVSTNQADPRLADPTKYLARIEITGSCQNRPVNAEIQAVYAQDRPGKVTDMRINGLHRDAKVEAAQLIGKQSNAIIDNSSIGDAGVKGGAKTLLHGILFESDQDYREAAKALLSKPEQARVAAGVLNEILGFEGIKIDDQNRLVVGKQDGTQSLVFDAKGKVVDGKIPRSLLNLSPQDNMFLGLMSNKLAPPLQEWFRRAMNRDALKSVSMRPNALDKK